MTNYNYDCVDNMFCLPEAIYTCRDTAIKNCSECNYSALVAFICVATILGIVIVLGNLLTLAVFIKRHRSGYDMKVDAIKMSLSVADLLTGNLSMFHYHVCLGLPYFEKLKSGHRVAKVDLTKFLAYSTFVLLKAGRGDAA